MRNIYTHQDYTRVGYFKSILDAEGISCLIRNESENNSYASSASPISYPTLCVTNDDDYDRAMEILKPHYEPEESRKPDWICPVCGETLPGSFEVCWKCHAESS